MLCGNLLQHFTGSKNHNIAMREEAQRRGLSISEYGVVVMDTGETITHRDEKELYEFLGYQFIPPELRESAGELEAARGGSLPKLVELRHLKGDLHSHTTWSSDGHNTVEEMAVAAMERGYEYLAVTDHSHYRAEGRMEKQDREIDAVNEKVAPFRLLKGVEVNIRADGSLDVPDEVLAERDWVVASIHSSFQRDPTERIWGRWKPTRRLHRPSDRAEDRQARERRHRSRPGDRDGFQDEDRDRDQLPARSDGHARSAGAAGGRGGVLVPVSSDAHSVGALRYPELGIGQARRAWLTKKHVLNTRSWAQIEKTLGG